MNIRPQRLLVLMTLMLASCGEGYVVEPGLIVIQSDEPGSWEQVLGTLSRTLEGEGFEDLGRYDEMIDLISGGSMDASVKEREIARLRREYSYLNEKSNLRIVATDYTAVDTSTVPLRYDAPYKKFVEVAVYEERPGGFSHSGLAFFQKLQTTLQANYPQGVVVTNEPPPTDEAEHKRINSVNAVSSILAWCVALLLSLAVIGFPLYFLAKRLRLPQGAKRTVFALVCTWLVAPVPLPATIVVVPGPNIFLFPWTDLPYYKEWGHFVVVSFVATLIVCAAISILGFRRASPGKEARRVDA